MCIKQEIKHERRKVKPVHIITGDGTKKIIDCEIYRILVELPYWFVHGYGLILWFLLQVFHSRRETQTDVQLQPSVG